MHALAIMSAPATLNPTDHQQHIACGGWISCLDARDADSPLWLRQFEKIAWRALRASLIIVVTLALAGIWLLTLGYDEAWMLQSISDAIRPRALDVTIGPVVTSGGVYAIVQASLTYLFGVTLWPKRMFSLVCAIAIGGFVWRWGRSRLGGGQGGALAVAGLAATPGIVVFSSTAIAVVPAILLVLLGLEAHARFAAHRWPRVAVVGLISGLAAATRFECGFLWPALFAVGLLVRKKRARELADAALVAAIGVAVLILCVAAYAHLGQKQGAVDRATSAAGLGLEGMLDYPFLLNKWMVSQEVMSLFFVVLVSAGAVVCASQSSRESDTMALPTSTALLPFAWLAWGFWLLRAPIPHLRYLWPAVVSLHILLGLSLAALHDAGQRNRRPALRVLALVLGLACTIACIGSGARQLIHGESNTLSFEWSGESANTRFTRFRQAAYQRQAVAYLRDHFGKDERVLAIGLSRELGYLAERDVLEISSLVDHNAWQPSQVPRRALVGPLFGPYLHLSDSARHWLELHCVVEAQFGPYVFYRVTGDYPQNASVLASTLSGYPGHPLAASWR